PRVVAQVKNLGRKERGPDRERNVRSDRSRVEVDAVALDITVDVLPSGVGVACLVGRKDFDRDTAEFAAELFQRQVETVARLGAECGERTRYRGREPDPHLFDRLGRGHTRGAAS